MSVSPETFVGELVGEVEDLRVDVSSIIDACIASGRVTDQCIENCPMLMVGEYKDSLELIRERITGDSPVPSRAMNIRDSLVSELSNQGAILKAILRNGCSSGPVSHQEDFGEIDGEPVRFTGYSCSQVKIDNNRGNG